MKNLLNTLRKIKMALQRHSQILGSPLHRQPVYFPICMGILTALSTSLLFVYLASSSTAAFVQDNIVRGFTNLNLIEHPSEQTSARLLLESPWTNNTNTTQKYFENKVVSLWGDDETSDDIKIAYAKNPKSRGVVNFNEGVVYIETIDGDMAVKRLREAIVGTMQGVYDGDNDLNEDALLFTNALAFLYETDPEYALSGVDWQNDADSVADKLLKNCRISRTTVVNGEQKVIQGIRLPLPKDTAVRANIYKKHITTYSEKYNLTTALIYAIMHTESNFNPHAVSTSKALGLMQVVPETAGQEVNAFLNGDKSVPSIDTLLAPEDNIKFGTTYIHLLSSQYFGKVTNKKSRRLCVIAAYNAGPGAVLRTFASLSEEGATPIDTINAMSTEEIYKTLITKMPNAETRRYVEVVTRHMLTYQGKV